ncbi:MAG: hypothetical protein LBB18_04150 [Puniceicoccales bacterium]|nr:hypothetical protein [Puniceicoccales bacterium]
MNIQEILIQSPAMGVAGGALKWFDRCGKTLRRLRRVVAKFFTDIETNSEDNDFFFKINNFPFFVRRRLNLLKKKVKLSHQRALENLREAVKQRKIRVIFVVNEICKWHGWFLYDLFERSDNFEPLLLVSKRAEDEGACEYEEKLSFFKNSGLRVESVYNPLDDKYANLLDFHPDIMFQEQPWQIKYVHSSAFMGQFILTCYTPYCFHMMVSPYDYLEMFHRFLWRYFVESPQHLESYKKRFNADNCVVGGGMHMDNYFSNKKPNESFWKCKSREKKRVIYAPHHTIFTGHLVATFRRDGQFILNLASMYPQTTWVLRPHPRFFFRVVDQKIMTRQELSDYISEWEKYGTVLESGDFGDLFRSSDCLITDCISFLADYFPTKNPVFHLRSDAQAVDFNDFGKSIIETYYQIHSNAELDRLFSRVVIDGDDFMKSKREERLKDLGLLEHGLASERVFEHIKAELGIQ